MKKKKIFITGAYGLLGTTLSKKLKENGYRIIRHGTKESRDTSFNLENFSILKKKLDKIKPNLIINLLALTNVDECERNIAKAYKLNVKYLKNLSEYLKLTNNKCRLIHISTDQVYFGKGPHKENDVNPINNYGITKFLGELVALENNALILRTNFVGKSENQRRKSLSDWFIENIKRGNKINIYNNIFFNPLEINYLSSLINKIMFKKNHGIFNLGSKNGLSKALFLNKIAKELNLDTKNCKIKKINFLKNVAIRPKDMIMNCKKFEKTFKMRLPSLQNQILQICKAYKN